MHQCTGVCRINFSKCTANGPSTLARASRLGVSSLNLLTSRLKLIRQQVLVSFLKFCSLKGRLLVIGQFFNALVGVGGCLVGGGSWRHTSALMALTFAPVSIRKENFWPPIVPSIERLFACFKNCIAFCANTSSLFSLLIEQHFCSSHWSDGLIIFRLFHNTCCALHGTTRI